MGNEHSKRKAEQFFASLTALMIRYRAAVVLVVLASTVLFISQIRTLAIDTSNEGFLHEDDPVLTTYYEFREQFGRDDMIAVAIGSKNIFTTSFLQRLKQLHEELQENVPHLNDITSMINVRNTRGEGDVLLVDDLLAEFPDSDEELERLKQRVMESPLYKNQLISEDGLLTSIIIECDVYHSSGDEEDLLAGFADNEPTNDIAETAPVYLSDKEITDMVEAVQSIAEKYQDEDFRVYVAGTPVITQTLKKFMMSDMKRFLRLAVLTIGICLFIMFRRVSGVVLPLLVVALTLAATLGLMAIVGIKFKLPTIILPSFLLAVGVGDSVHTLALTYLNLQRGKSRNDSIIGAYSHAGLALVMTSLTTAAGLASFALAKVAPIADLGLFSSIGVMIALLYTLTVLPAILSYLPLKVYKCAVEDQVKRTRMGQTLEWIADFSVRRHRPILAVSGTIIAISIIGLFRVQFSHNVLKWLPEHLAIRQSTEVMNQELRGSVVLELILDTGRENGLYDQETLKTIDRLTQSLEADYQNNRLFVGKTISMTTILKEIHQALHGNNPQFYKIPENEKLIPQELLLFENSGSDDLEDSIDSQFRIARISLKVPWLDALLYVPFIQDVEKRFLAEFGGKKLSGGEEMQVTVTGIMSLFGGIIYASIYSAAQSYGIALVVVTLLMVILIGEVRMGLISMIPNLGPILLVLGFIGWFSIPLNMFTMLVASIAIGLSVDNTIHFMYNFKKYYEQSGDLAEGVRNALNTAGRALLTTTVVLSIGFFIFMFASMKNLFEFGLFTGIAIVLALASNFFMAPALLIFFLGKTRKI